MDDLTRIQAFIKVVEAGSFSAAARHESSISSVARQVKSLEDELGVRLLNRTTRSLSLTEPGRIFYERACLIVKDLNNAKMAARSFHDDVKGQLRVALRISVGTTLVAHALPAFLEQYPELSLDVMLTDERSDLVANNIDVAIWLGNIPDINLVARPLTPGRRVVCAAPGYLERHGTPRVPEDLREHNCILFIAPSHGNVWTFTKDGVEHAIEVRGNLRSANGLVLLSSAEAELGLVVVNEWMVRSSLRQGRLTRVLPDYQVRPAPSGAELYAVYPSSRGLSRNVRVFVDFLIDLFGSPQPEPAARPAE